MTGGWVVAGAVAGDPFEALGDGHRREILRLLSRGDKAGARAGGGAADQPPRGVASPAAPEGRRHGVRAGRRDVAHLPPPATRACTRCRPTSKACGATRPRDSGSSQRTPTPAAPMTDPLRDVVRRGVLGRPRVHRLDDGHRHVVAARPHRHRAATTSPSCCSARSAAASTSARPRASSTTGARSACCDPPERLSYLWHLGCDPADATEVDIRFVARGAAATRVEIEHRGWERLGRARAAWRDRNQAGWESLLPLSCRSRSDVMAEGTKDDPWVLKTPPGSSEYTMYRDERPIRQRWCARSGRRPCATTCAPSTICMPGSSRRVTGCRWGGRRAEGPRPTAPSRRGVARPTTLSAGGTGCARATAGASACTCRRCSRSSASQRSLTTPRNNKMRAVR